MDFALNLLTQVLALTFPSPAHQHCLSLRSSLQLENTTILGVSYHASPSKLKTLGVCQSAAGTSVPLCRVQFQTRTSESSGITAEAWLPDEWHGRFMAIGNGGLGGCIDYSQLDHGSALHFATVGSNNGHDGDTALPFFNNPEVLTDFSHRSIHVQSLIGKQIVQAYYGRPHSKSYYLGCSTGGRQGTQSALKYPDEFDGVIAGAPAIDFTHLIHWTGMLSRYIGAPDASSSPAFIPLDLWQLIAAELLRQCDALDGVLDGIIADPDACDFRPEALLCDGKKEPCLTQAQVGALRKIYSPLYGPEGEMWYPRFSPGSEKSPLLSFALSGQFPAYPEEWMKYVVLNTSFDASTYGLKDGILIASTDITDVATFSGDLSAFRGRGGKFLAFHGTADPIIPSGISKRYYDLVARTMGMPATSMDEFYRFFVVPGMDHCSGAAFDGVHHHIGQVKSGANANESSSHVVLAMVDWVEGGVAPEEIVGRDEVGTKRRHCRYPRRSVWDGEFICV
ncbi:tannase and feruloyl esterase [Roridomyces roridus]|uniref:Carboxylic ester hydrolase n=1 Tax=Roridomyces roridus TaxID=1738132 RepID=A0AAD7C7W5_9AGAR|nr:tannase and feruloyl esterase [Roridomyces roridus]